MPSQRHAVAIGSLRNSYSMRQNEHFIAAVGFNLLPVPGGAKAITAQSNGFSGILMAKAPLRLKRRADFLRARRGKSVHARGFGLQAVPQLPAPHEAELPASRVAGDSTAISYRSGQAQTVILANGGLPYAQPRFGFTVGKHCGGAVRRNRIRRRLKEALRLVDPLPARLGYDYVIVARPEALGMAFAALQAELARALGRAGTLDRPTARGTGTVRPASAIGRKSQK
jgi:ribonuclease P protein component